MYISILQAQYMGDFKILFNFNDKVSRLVDFKPFLQKSKHLTVKNYLQKESLFQNFKIEYGDIYWNDFELCFPIDNLHQGKIN